ncbi:hypothetical protein KI387_027988, partial [Taxus chinensis]
MSSFEEEVNPKQVRFSQASIASHFSSKHGKGTSLNDVCTKLKISELTLSDFPPIRLSKDRNGDMQSHHNRRLWVFREAGVSNGRLFALDAVTSSSVALSASTAESTALWHFRYGHLSAGALHQLSAKEM